MNRNQGMWAVAAFLLALLAFFVQQKTHERHDNSIPTEFSWQSFLIRNPHLRESGVRDAHAAWMHHQRITSSSSRSDSHGTDLNIRRIPVILRYNACGGLFNQMYAHIAAWILADVLGADVIMPPSLYRNSYGSQYSIHGVSELKWLPTNISSLLDMEGVRQGYEARGRQVYEHPLTITEAPESSSLSESGGIGEECASHPQSAYLSGSIPESGLTFDPYQIVRMNDVYMRASSLDAIWDEAANLIMKKHESLLASGRSPATPILLDLPSAFFSIMTITCLDRARLAVLALPFNLTLLSLASRIVRRIKRGGRDQFNGIHFRFERDAADWIEAYGGAEAYLDLYLRTAKGAGLDTSHRDLYVASGLLSYADEEERKWLHDILGPYGRKLIYKESGKIQKITRNVTGGSLEDLNTEQRALVDFLVLAHSHVFVGLGTSSFSVYLREYRRIHGLGEEGRGGNVFVSSKSVGTDSLFQRCGHLGEIKN